MKVKISQPIERIRGGEIIVCVEVEENGNSYSAFATTAENSESSIQNAFDKAYSKCKTELEKISSTNVVLANTLIDLCSPKVVEQYTQLVDDKKLSPDILKQLDSPCDEHKQKELNNLCEALGIDLIDAQTRGYTMLQVIALNSALNRMASKLESKKKG